MKNRWILLLLSCATLLHAKDLQDVSYDKIAESLGHYMAEHLAKPGFPLNLDLVIKGFEDERKGLPSPMSKEEYEQAICMLQEKMYSQLAEENLAKANAFLEENARKEGITVVEPKLHYRIEKAGEGECVGEECRPLVHYKGFLIDGTIFANSFEGEEPVMLPLKQTMPGFTKGLIGMKEGEKRTLYIHPDLAAAMMCHLPPNSLLIFEVEVLKANAPSEDIAQLP